MYLGPRVLPPYPPTAPNLKYTWGSGGLSGVVCLWSGVKPLWVVRRLNPLLNHQREFDYILWRVQGLYWI